MLSSLIASPHPKRRRMDQDHLSTLLETGSWSAALQFVRESTHWAEPSIDPSPLALACRCGAPYDLIKALVEQAPAHLRRVLDSRGTPLHEAIVCEKTGVDVIALLLKTDEDLGTESQRATLLQDVDGFTPLHLLIRRRFRAHILQEGDDPSLMQILEMLVRSCPDSVVIPDRGEYEEPPIVYAIKANIYAPGLGNEDVTEERVERQIYEMVDCMLRYNPAAASRVFSGYRGQYTALHSAVFHGRYTATIELILRAEAASRGPHREEKAALLHNTQGEIPLHFCAMRGERPRSIAVIAEAAPEAVMKRDTSGLTPFHWLWIRFVSTLLTLQDGRGAYPTVSIGANRPTPFTTNKYNAFAMLEQGDFRQDLQLIKRMDPAVDFLRMRHIPEEAVFDGSCLSRTNKCSSILWHLRNRYESTPSTEEGKVFTWNREQVVHALFWSKVVSLLEACQQTTATTDNEEGSTLLHTAFSSKCCLPVVAHIVATVFPEECEQRDNLGRLPIHCAASRPWDRWDWPTEEGYDESIASLLLESDSLTLFRVALTHAPSSHMQIPDNENRLVLNCLIDSMVISTTRMARSIPQSRLQDMLGNMLFILHSVIKLYPDAALHVDGRTKLRPFLQAAATASAQGDVVFEPFSISVSYELLRLHPNQLEILR